MKAYEVCLKIRDASEEEVQVLMPDGSREKIYDIQFNKSGGILLIPDNTDIITASRSLRG